MQKLFSLYALFIEKLKLIDWLGPLALRLYLAPIFIGVGAHKFANWGDMVAWFGNSDWGLGLPLPALMVFLAASAELFGGLALHFDDEWYIQIKPTVISGGLALFLAGGQLLKKAPLKALLGQQMALDDKGWQKVTWVWTAMFAVSAGANEIAWRILSTDDWVTFKTFGLTLAMFGFFMAQAKVLDRYGIKDQA